MGFEGNFCPGSQIVSKVTFVLMWFLDCHLTKADFFDILDKKIASSLPALLTVFSFQF